MGFLLLLGSPFLNVNVSSPDATILPERVAARQGFETLRAGVWRWRDFTAGDRLAESIERNEPREPGRAVGVYARLAADERVARIDSLVTLDPRFSLEQYQLVYDNPAEIRDVFLRRAYQEFAGQDATMVLVYPRGLAGSDESKELLADIRASSPGGDYTMLVDGGTAEIVDVVEKMYSEFPRVALVIVAATYVVLLFLLRSVLLPLKAIVMNTLSILASYGALVYIFQEGNFSSLLGFEPLGFVEASLPIFMFCILFGLSMDYEVFLLSRVSEA